MLTYQSFIEDEVKNEPRKPKNKQIDIDRMNFLKSKLFINKYIILKNIFFDLIARI
jgi:hypothetical protein